MTTILKSHLRSLCFTVFTMLALVKVDAHAAPWAPEPTVADDTGNWSSITFVELQIRLNGFQGYETTGENNQVAAKYHHPQHVVRLPNKVGADGLTRAYFAITQSNRFYSESLVEHVTDGYWLVAEIDPQALDTATDQLVSTALSDGRYVYEEHFNSNRDEARDEYAERIAAKKGQGGKPDQMVISLAGDWTHPAKMAAFDGILLMVGQNWSPTFKPFFFPSPGDSLDAVLFYDVRDPVTPKFLGMLNSEELGIEQYRKDGELSDDDGSLPYEGWRKIDSIGLGKSENGTYHLGVQNKNFFCHESNDCFINPTTPGKWVPEDVVYGDNGLPKGSNVMSGGQGGIFHSKEIHASVPAAHETCYDALGNKYPGGTQKPAECSPAGTRRTMWFEPAEDSVLPNAFTLACDIGGEGCNLGEQNRMGLPLFRTLKYDFPPPFSATPPTFEATSHFAGRYSTVKNEFVSQLFGDCGPGGGIQVSNQKEPLIYCVSESSSEPIGCPEGGECNRLWQNAAASADTHGIIIFTHSDGTKVTYRGRGLPFIDNLSDPPWGPGLGKGAPNWRTGLKQIEIVEGTWLIYDQTTFETPGTVRTAGPGIYFPGISPWDTPVLSFRVLPDQGISLFEHGNYFGRMVNTVRSNPALPHTCGDNAHVCWNRERENNCNIVGTNCDEPRTFNDKASSAIVASNSWTLYVEDGLSADEGYISNVSSSTNGNGRIPSLRAFGDDYNDAISSVGALCEAPTKPAELSVELLEPGRPLITWRNDIYSAYYEVQFADTEPQVPPGGVYVPVTEIRTEPKYLPGATLDPGTYEVRVRGVSSAACALKSPYSDSLTVTIAEPPPPPVQLGVEVVSEDSAGRGSGKVAVSPAPVSQVGGDYYRPGDRVTLAATPTSHSEFARWGGDAAGCGSSPTCDVTIEAGAGMTVQAIFRPKPRLIVYIKGGGTANLNPLGQACANADFTCLIYSTGDTVTMTPAARPDSAFDRWEGDPDCLDGTVSLTEDLVCTAVFKNTSYKLTVGEKGAFSGPSAGSSIVSDPAGSINCGTGTDCEEVYPVSGGEKTVILNATIDPGSVFVRWDGAFDCWNEDENDGNPLRISVKVGTKDVHCSVIAVPAGTEYALTVEKVGGGTVEAVAMPVADSSGIDCLENACSQNYPVNTQVQLTATATRGSVFAGFDGDPDCEDGVVSMVEHVTCIARFNSRVLVVNGANDDSSKEQNEYIPVLRQMEFVDYDIWSVKNPNSGDNSTDPATGKRRVEPVASDLAKYGRVIWYTDRNVYYTRPGGVPAGPSPAAEAALADYLDDGGCLLMSSSQYFTDRGLTPFAQDYLGVGAITPDVTESHVRGAGDPTLGFSNLVSEVGVNPPNPFRFQASRAPYRSDVVVHDPDVQGSDVLFTYRDGSGEAGIVVDNGIYRTAFLGFPFLGLNSGNDRINVLRAFMDLCGQPDRDDRFEVNDDFDGATERKGFVSLKDLRIRSGNDDYFRWESGWYADTRFRISFAHVRGDLAIEVYDRNRGFVARSQTEGDSEEIVVPKVDAGQVYFIRVFGRNGASNQYKLEIAAAGSHDRDHDGVTDTEDAFPEDPFEQYDEDGDFVGDNADPDDDNDGMPDAYEKQKGFDPLDAADASADDDDDGLTNLDEFLGGSDPKDPTSGPVLPFVVGPIATVTPTATSDTLPPTATPTATETPSVPTATPTGIQPPPACAGDCNADQEVTVNEIITAVNIALGEALATDCPAADQDESGDVTVDEILTAVNNALNGCPS